MATMGRPESGAEPSFQTGQAGAMRPPMRTGSDVAREPGLVVGLKIDATECRLAAAGSSRERDSGSRNRWTAPRFSMPMTES